ncbi:MAG TPA: cation-transporting P-type ATPase, partial [Bacteroidales bacterium]|nr:cation-transporting P-type ATPase [Bacteroidales bacterium]
MKKGTINQDQHPESSIQQEKWYALELDEVYKKLDSSNKGLETDEVNERLNFYGKNTLPPAKPVTLLQIILHQLINPLIFILLAAAVASIAIGEAKDAAF